MTREEREEAARIIKECKDKGFKHTFYTLNEYHTALDTAIKALEQEPCEDKIIEWKNDFKGYVNALSMPRDDCNGIMEYIDELPVTPQQKTGHRIKSRDSYGNNHFTCPFCEHDIATKADTLGDNYCSNCGAKMQGVEE